MARFSITDSQTGRTLTIEGDAPPTEQDAQELFDSLPKPLRLENSPIDKAKLQEVEATKAGLPLESYSESVPKPLNPDYDFTRATGGGTGLPLALLSKGIDKVAHLSAQVPFSPLNMLEAPIKKLSGYTPKEGESVIPPEALPLADPSEHGVIPELTRVLKGFTTEGGIITLPLAELKPVQAYFLAQSGAAIPANITEILQAETPGELKDALTKSGVNLGMGALMARGLTRKPPEAPVQGPRPTGAVLQMPKGAKPLATIGDMLEAKGTPLPEAPVKLSETDELSALRKKDLTDDGLTKDEEKRFFELSRKETALKRADKTKNQSNLLKEAGVTVPDDFLHPSEGVENHITGWTRDKNGFIQVRVETHTASSSSAKLITVKPGDTLSHGMNDTVEGTTRYKESNPDAATTPKAPVKPSVLPVAASEATKPPQTPPVVESAPKAAPVTFKGVQKGAKGIPDMEYYDLTEDIPGHRKGSTMGRKELESLGYTIPEQSPEQSEFAVVDKPKASDKRAKIISEAEKAFDAAQSKNKAIVDHQAASEDGPDIWNVYSSERGNDRQATVSQDDKGQFVVEDERGSTIKWEKTAEDALQEAKWHVEGGDTQEKYNLNSDARSEILNTLDLPKEWSIEDIQDTKWGSVYYKLRKQIGVDADGEPEYETYKVSIRNHEPSPFREKEFGANDAYYEVPKDATPQQLSDAVAKVERFAQRRSENKGATVSAQPPSQSPETPNLVSSETPPPVKTEVVVQKPIPKEGKEQVGKLPESASMGGALPSELENKPTTPTGIKNATVEKERAARGLPPAVEPARRSFGTVWDEAMAKVDNDPRSQDDLISELKKKPRAVTDLEDAMLLQRQIELQNEHAKLTREMNQAFDDATQFPDRMDAVEELKPRVAAISDELLDLYNINKRVGTETGRGLAARKMMAYEDYSLAALETKLRAAKGGKTLTPEEAGTVKKVAERVSKAQKEVEDFQENVKGTEAKEPQIPNAEKDALDAANKTVREAATRLAAEETKVREADAVRSTEVRRIQERASDKAGDAADKTVREAAIRAAREESIRRVKQADRDKATARIQVDYAKRALDRANKTVREAAIRLAKAESKARIDAAAEAAKKSKNPRLNALKTRYSKRFEELIAKMAGGDLNIPGRKPLVLDPEATRLKANYENAKLEFDRLVMRERLKNRPIREKVQDTFVKWRRAFLLSSPVTLAKLTSAAIERMIITPAEEAVGGAYSKIPMLSRIAERAPREGGINAKAEAKALTEGFVKGMSDAWQTLRTGKSDLDTLFGKREIMPREAIDFIGSIHGALKAPVKRAEFRRSFEKRMEFNIRNGVDVTGPLVQTKIALEAFKDAQRSIFMQDNRVTSAYNAAVGRLEQPDKLTGKVPTGSKLIASTARTLLPIVKVPTNIVAETMQYAVGTVTGSTRAAIALRRGVETLKPEDADLIMRDLKKGSLGAALLTLGYLSPNLVGGYYQANDKKQTGHPKFGTVKIGDTQIPTYLIHNPLLEMLQVGATVRHVADSKLRKKDKFTQGFPAGAVAATLGVASEVPFVREQEELVKVLNPYERQQYFNQFAKDLVVPLGVKWVAEHFDKDAKGNYTPRDPKTLWQSIESAIPGLREKVLVDAKKQRHQDHTP